MLDRLSMANFVPRSPAIPKLQFEHKIVVYKYSLLCYFFHTLVHGRIAEYNKGNDSGRTRPTGQLHGPSGKEAG